MQDLYARSTDPVQRTVLDYADCIAPTRKPTAAVDHTDQESVCAERSTEINHEVGFDLSDSILRQGCCRMRPSLDHTSRPLAGGRDSPLQAQMGSGLGMMRVSRTRWVYVG